MFYFLVFEKLEEAGLFNFLLENASMRRLANRMICENKKEALFIFSSDHKTLKHLLEQVKTKNLQNEKKCEESSKRRGRETCLFYSAWYGLHV